MEDNRLIDCGGMVVGEEAFVTSNPRIYHRSLLVVIIPLSDAQKMYESEVQKDFKFMLAVKVRRLNRTTQKRIRDFCGGGIHSHTHLKTTPILQFCCMLEVHLKHHYDSL